ncbi:hypothetical protein M8C21_012668 [Ambrosia artemisiifolia]|uniref:Uncharacterized protein n=1 Tax=Ambrosia artemisiifolia TaxID=4212 RepID=A0AAD5CSD7_AMBAR|nr:hypothetical protein M8C21_012668 [Ambrosia artemisiifolia]
MNDLVVPDNVSEWLEEVEKIKLMGVNIPIDGVTCLNMKMRYKVGKQSFYLLKDMELLINEKSKMVWTDEMIPIAIVSPPRPTTSTTVFGDDQNRNQNRNNIKSRYLIFNAALKSFDPSDSDKQQKIALCGMSGIGKTTMMEQLKEVAKERKMFDLIVKIDIV